MPETAVGAVRALHPAFLLARHDLRRDDADALSRHAAAAAAVGARLHLELVLPGRDLGREAASLAAQIEASGATVDLLLVFPAADLKGTLPGSPWPECPPLDAVYAAVRAVLPGARLAGGTPNFFTELNRKRPPIALLDAVTFSTSAIVHAADDLTVMENLEALPAVFRSAAELAAGRPLYLGPSHIGCRDNPYGAAASPNPECVRKAMTNRDPRHAGAFAAAWMVGYVASCIGTDVAHATLGAPVGAFGVLDDAAGTTHGARPVHAVLAALGEAGRAPAIACRSSDPDRLACLAWQVADGVRLLLANLTSAPLQCVIADAPTTHTPYVLAPYETRLADADRRSLL